MSLRFHPLRSTTDPLWEAAMGLYHEAFPPKERRSEADLVRALGDPLFRAEAILWEERFAGILFYWLFGPTRYVEYLAVDPALRGHRLGSEALALLCRGQRVILEIEPPTDEPTRRRQRFYERAGFRTNPHDYLHPSYNRPFDPHRLVLMSYPSPLENDEARLFADFVRERVLAYSEHPEGPTTPVLP